MDQELDKNEGETAKRRYFYITLLREPISRYLSEWRHVQRGATWKNSRHWCLGRQATTEELPACYQGTVRIILFLFVLNFSLTLLLKTIPSVHILKQKKSSHVLQRRTVVHFINVVPDFF